MLELCRKAGSLETGGLLIGRYSLDHRTATVESATGPGDDARAGRTWLQRGVQGLQQLLDALWNGRSGYYLGEWHFHPAAPPVPSARDLNQMRSIAASEQYQCPEPVLLIVGGDPGGAHAIHVEVFIRSGGRKRLDIVEDAPRASPSR